MGGSDASDQCGSIVQDVARGLATPGLLLQREVPAPGGIDHRQLAVPLIGREVAVPLR